MHLRNLAAVPIAAFAVLAFAHGAAAEEIKLKSRVEAVTVFPRGATVTRQAPLKLPGGQHALIIEDLPAGVVTDSVRISGRVSGNLLIGAVDVRRQFVATPESEERKTRRKEIEDEIKRLRFSRNEQSDIILAAEAQKALIQNLANLPNRPASAAQGSALRSPEEWDKLFVLIGENISKAQFEIRKAEQRIKELDEKITALEKELADEPARRERRTKVRVAVKADGAVEGTLRIRYQVSRASWRPQYEARLMTAQGTANGAGAPRLALIRRAIVSQATGEDWREVALTLSTTEPERGTKAPDLPSLVIDFQREPKPVPLAKRIPVAPSAPAADVRRPEDDLGGFAMSERRAFRRARMKAAALKRAARNIGAGITRAPFQALYAIPGRVSIKTEGGDKKVEIDRNELAATLDVRMVPRLSEKAFLYASFALGKNLRLLPGPVALFRDGVFVGKGSLPTLAGGERHELGFGIDDAVRVKFAELKRQRSETGTFSKSKTELRRFKVTVQNHHKRKTRARIIDHVPVSRNTEIVVEARGAAARPNVKDLDDRPGVIAWDIELAPGAEKVLEYGYEVSWPVDKKIRYLRKR